MLRRKIKKITRNRQRLLSPSTTTDTASISPSSSSLILDEQDPPGQGRNSGDQSELMLFVKSYDYLRVIDDGVVTKCVSECIAATADAPNEPVKLLPFYHTKRKFALSLAEFQGTSHETRNPDVPATKKVKLDEGDAPGTSTVGNRFQDNSNGETIRRNKQILTTDEIVATSSILVGMHPDQVTEAIIDIALAYRKPFAVVPCCVFAELFPDRQVSDTTATQSEGRFKSVQTYEEFIKYLCSKDSGIHKFDLPFWGRSTVLFHMGDYER
jgi:hypothetical protein